MKKILILFFFPMIFLLLIVIATVPSVHSNDSGTMMIDENTEVIEDTTDYIPTGDSEVGNNIVKYALLKLGSPYVWGAEGPNSFDCSGLVYWACKQAGVNFTRTTAEVLSTMGSSVTYAYLQPGDIITFKTIPSYVSHVGIYIGDGKMVHAPNETTVVKVENVLNSKYWMSVLYNCRRLY